MKYRGELKLEFVTNAERGRFTTTGEVGEPRGTKAHTSEELAEMGIIGVYKRPGDKNFQLTPRKFGHRFN